MIRRVFLDTNVLLDLLAWREPHAENARRVWELCEKGACEGWISAISFNNLHYLLRKDLSASHCLSILRDLRRLFRVAPLDSHCLDAALESSTADFEDNIQLAAAIRARAEVLITRNKRDFHNPTDIRVQTPREFLDYLDPDR